MLIDTHAHLTDKRVEYKNVIANMQQDRLARIITVGYNYANSVEGLKIAESDGRIFCTLGIHPNDSKGFESSQIDAFLKLSTNPKVVAIGEIGLDYHYPDTDKKQQHKVLLAQLELAKAADLPVAIHMRDADEDMQKVLRDNQDKIPRGGVMHCYSGSLESAKIYIDLGLYVSFSGSITFNNAKKYPDIIKNLPLDKILIETDCPYLTPQAHRGQTNYPKYVAYQAKAIAEFRGVSVEEIEKATYDNAFRLFGKMV